MSTIHLIEPDPNRNNTPVLYEVNFEVTPLGVEALDAGVPEAWRAAIRGCRLLIAHHQSTKA